MRVDKILAHCGFGTRKEVKKLLKNGIVEIDGEVIKNPAYHVNPAEQTIYVANEKVIYEQYIYLMLNKPQGYLSATYDMSVPTVIDLVPLEYAHFDLAPVGRLDKDTEGLILLTNDGKLNHAITSPKKNIFKTYYAKIDGKVEESHGEIFKNGVILDDGYETKQAHLEIIKSDLISEVKLSISEGKFHQVKRMFQAIDMEVIYLQRLSIGDLDLDPTLQLGDTRRLTDDEIEQLLVYKAR